MRKIELNILPLAISILLMLISIGIAISSDYVIHLKHYVGIGCVVLSTIFYFKNRKVYHYFFTLTLIAGLIGFLDFYIATYEVGFAEVRVNPIFLGLLVLLLMVDKELWHKIFPND